MNKQILLQKINLKLQEIYDKEYKEEFLVAFNRLITYWEEKGSKNIASLSEKNSYLITYGDSFYEENKPNLETLRTFLSKFVKDSITDVHLLPMFPYTSDDGFSVVDYRKINPQLGEWEQIEELARDYRLMFDFVANHVSKSSEWFQGYLLDEPEYKEYFIPSVGGFDSTQVVRPRTSPLFHQYLTKKGEKSAWSTFSEDQVDVNFKHFPVLLEMTDILIWYADKGATSIRLDAIGFIWKESGSSCIHLPQAHAIIQLWNMVLDYLKPNTQIITETNVPHKENVSYFGDGTNEAHMVYQFSLPPLVLHTFTTHNSQKISAWAKTIDKVSDTATYFNFLSSHDGIGMRPTESILSDEERQMLINKVVENGGRISYKTNPDGSQSVYEMNINYNDALINKDEDLTEEQQIRKILAAHSILFSVIGVPAIYYHSLLGSRNDYMGLEQSGIKRRINREKLEFNKIKEELEHHPRRKAIFEGMISLLNIRSKKTAFSPFASQTILDLSDKVFALKREYEKTNESIIFVVNVDNNTTEMDTDISGIDIITGRKIDKKIILQPYEYIWIEEKTIENN
ncbi:sugar phosphorylase [Bacillus sp. JJ722]|uniref:sugar phosphorylase n=1 Tax=Bacillus sp. JJ722 TaxID=3122973 RepID=UPI00300013D7